MIFRGQCYKFKNHNKYLLNSFINSWMQYIQTWFNIRTKTRLTSKKFKTETAKKKVIFGLIFCLTEYRWCPPEPSLAMTFWKNLWLRPIARLAQTALVDTHFGPEHTSARNMYTWAWGIFWPRNYFFPVATSVRKHFSPQSFFCINNYSFPSNFLKLFW